MANELHLDYSSGNNVYVIVRNSSGQIWYPAGQAFENWGGGAGRDMDNYDIAMTDETGSRYVVNFDTNISAGRYTVQFFQRAGANPADSDTLIASGEIEWNGSAEDFAADKISIAKTVLANKAIQNKVTGAIDYYDDNGQAVVLTHTPTDGESAITRTPS